VNIVERKRRTRELYGSVSDGALALIELMARHGEVPGMISHRASLELRDADPTT